MANLREALQATADGSGGALIIEGPPGIGKSRLLEMATTEATGLGMAVAAGRATELDRVAPLTTLLTTLQRFEPPGLDLRGIRGQDGNRFWLINKIGGAIENYVRTRPLLLVIDDAQWVDEVTALALRVLVPALSSSPVLWLLARRQVPKNSPAQDAIDWLIGEGARRLRLGPLSDSAVTGLCAHLLDAVPDATVMALAARSGGNPFLVEQLLIALRRTRQVLISEGTATLVGDELPSSFLAAVDQRLHGLSPDARRMLEVGSVLGRPFTVHAAAQMMGRSAAELLTAADEAVAAGALVDCGFELAFRHDLLREAVYNNLSGPVRSVLHREAATVVRGEGRSPVEIAEHLVRGGNTGSGEAIEMLREAAAQTAANAPGTAADLVLRALDLIGEHDPGRPQLIADAVRMLASAGRLVEAGALGETALHGGLDAPTEAALRLGLAEALKHAGHNTEVVHHTERALSRTGVPEPLSARLLAVASHALLYEDPGRAESMATEAIARGAAADEHAAPVFGGVARSVVARTRGRLDEAVNHARRAAQLADTVGGEARHRHPRLWLACAMAALDQFDEAEAMYTAGQREAEQLGTAWSQPLWHFYRASLLMASGRLDDAQAEAEAGIRVAEQLTALQLTVPLLALMAQVAIRRCAMAQAREHLHRTQRLLAEGITVASEHVAWALAQLQAAGGEPAAAHATLAQLYKLLPERMLLITDDPGAAPALVRMALRVGATVDAKTVAAAARELADSNPTVASFAGAAAHAEGLINRNPESLSAAVAHYRSSPRPLARASALEDAAVAEHAAGRHRQAVALLDEALGLYRTCGAQLDLARVRKRLRAFGVRRASGTDPATGGSTWDALTESELRVVRLVAEGLTNREVADRLYLSPHTVDSHLRHVFTKLTVNSRVELTRKFVAASLQN